MYTCGWLHLGWTPPEWPYGSVLGWLPCGWLPPVWHNRSAWGWLLINHSKMVGLAGAPLPAKGVWHGVSIDSLRYFHARPFYAQPVSGVAVLLSPLSGIKRNEVPNLRSNSLFASISGVIQIKSYEFKLF